MTPEEEIIESLKKASSARAYQFISLELSRQNLDVDRLAELAHELPVPNRLGYLAEASAVAAENAGIGTSRQLYRLAEILFRDDYDWAHLSPKGPDFARRIASSRPQSDLNQKWRIFTTIGPSDIGEWLSLYGIKEEHEKRGDVSYQAGSPVNY